MDFPQSSLVLWMKLKLIAVTQLTQSSNSILRLVAIIFSFLNVADLVYPSYFEEDITYLGSGILRMQIISNDIVEIFITKLIT